MQVAYAYPLVPVANFLCAFLVLIPLPWLLQHWNIGAWATSIWISLACFVTGVNTVIWSDDARITAVVWCDISVRVYHAASLGIVTTNFVMARRVCLIMYLHSPLSEYEKRKAKLFDLSVSIGVPILSVALSWFVQRNRFIIYEGLGCFFAYYNTPLYIALYNAWFVFFALLAVIYACFIFWALNRRRNALREPANIDPEVSFEQFRRVIALGCAECIFTVPCVMFLFVNELKAMVPWTSLADAHRGFSTIDQVPRSAVGSDELFSILWTSWVNVFVALVVFLFFGSSRAMWVDYWKEAGLFVRRLGFKWPRSEVGTDGMKEKDEVSPPIVFHNHIRSSLRTSMTQSRATGTMQFGDSQGGTHRGTINSSSSVSRSERGDVEKGMMVDSVSEKPAHVEDSKESWNEKQSGV